jgi:hypothetical protein
VRSSFLASESSLTYTLTGLDVVNIKNVSNKNFQTTIFRELSDVRGPLVRIIPFTMLFYGAHFSFYYEHERHVEGSPLLNHLQA